MGRKTSVYLSDEDLERIRAAGYPPIIELIRAGLSKLEQWPAQQCAGSQGEHGGPAHR